MYGWVVLGNRVPQYFKIEYSNTTKYRLATCSTNGHIHECFLGIKQCPKRYKQLVQTPTTILDLSVKLTFFGIL